MDTYGEHQVKLPAGDLILYPSTSLHQVLPVTRGERVCSFFWSQSQIRDDAKRALLYSLDQQIQSLRLQLGDSSEEKALYIRLYELNTKKKYSEEKGILNKMKDAIGR